MQMNARVVSSGSSPSRSVSASAKRILLWLFLIALTAVYLFPLYFDLISSVKSTTEIFVRPFSPTRHPLFSNFRIALDTGRIQIAFFNSLILSVGSIAIVISVSSLASYVLAKMRFRLQNAIYVLFIAGLMVPVQAVLIPLAIQVSLTRMSGSYVTTMLIFTAQFLPLAVFILVGFMRSIPTEMEEAVYVDGGGHFRIFWNVILPLSKAGLSTVVIFVFLMSWNDLLIPLVFMGATHPTVSLRLLSFFGGMTGQSGYGAFMAAVLFVIVPPIALYIAASDLVQQGLTAGAVKG